MGHTVLLGGERMSVQVLCKVPSTCAAMHVETFRENVRTSPELAALLLRYTRTLYEEITQIAACNRFHSLEQRLARYLLRVYDRLGLEEFPVTHEFLAEELGVRRATVTEAVATLQRDDAIRTARGRVVIADRARLEAAACECYRVLTEQYDRVVR